MAVDEKYIEEVKDDVEFDDIMAELGLEGEFQQIGNGVDLEGYEITYLRDMWDGDECFGKPVISDIYTTEFTDKNTGETKIYHKIDLVLLDNSDENNPEAYVFTCNLKEDNIDEEKKNIMNVHSASGLYALAMGLAELRLKGISKNFNFLKNVGYVKLQKDAAKYDELGVKVVEKKMVDKKTKEETFYNSFRIFDGTLAE